MRFGGTTVDAATRCSLTPPDAVSTGFDLERLEFSGRAQVVANDVSHGTNFGWSVLSVSGNGAIVYQSLSPAVTQPTWFSRAGQHSAVASDEGSYDDLNDGQKFLVNHLVHSGIPRTTIILNWAGQ